MLNTYFDPPPFIDLYCFPQLKFIIIKGCALQVKNVQPFFAILYILSQLGKIMHIFYQLGKKYAFTPFFILLGEGVKQKNIHPCFSPRETRTIIVHRSEEIICPV